MVSKHFLTAGLLCAVLLLGADVDVYGGHGGGGGGHGGGGGGGHGGGYGGGHGGYGYGGRGYGYGGGFYGGGFYGGGLFYGDYITGGGYPGYYAPYAYPVYPTPGYSYADPYYSPRIASNQPANSYYYPPITLSASPATIHVVLPDPQATVLFDGRPTTSVGSERYYHTPELTAGGSYQYRLRVSWMQDGKQMIQEKAVAVTPGRTSDVVFSRADAVPAISSAK